MFEVPTFNVDKFVHTLIQNLGLRIQSPVYKNFNKITFNKYVDRACRINQQLFYTIERIRDINIKQNLDFSNEKDIQYYIEKHTRLFDKFASLSNTWISKSHLKNLNVRILQKVKARRTNFENTKKVEAKILNKKIFCKKKAQNNLSNKLDELKKNLLSPTLCSETSINLHNYKRSKCRKAPISKNPNIVCHDKNCKDNISKIKNNNQKVSVRHNLSNNLINVAKTKTEMAEGFLYLHTKDIESIKRKVHVTLYITKNESYDHDIKDQIQYNQLLCQHAILCLIEPSKKAFVLFEDDLSIIIQKYLSQGYKYHFEFQRNSQEYCTALLILSQWAKVLVKHLNTTMMLTISGILGCDVQEVLVLDSPEEKLL
ncbi:uncharacterized protein LOC143352141 isoform X1 [Colletes latitarsis]|uniref:uncharacterized protein LOC143352141 isoform X1 n=1 Tax=Colletes latitarsis TaxID=2605962 RepID=UPI0040368E5F